jgi:hypothetical protein
VCAPNPTKGLSFSKCHAEKAIMNDPKLNQIFDGEEFGRGARLWTSGYDFYTPHKNYVFHGKYVKVDFLRVLKLGFYFLRMN